jgi:hypothetical protein
MAKVITTDELTLLNRDAVRAGYNRSVTDEFIHMLDPDGVHVVEFHFLHERRDDVQVRVMLLCKVKGTMTPVRATVDLHPDAFNRLRQTEAVA